MAKEGWILIRELFKHGPNFDALPELLVGHYNDGHKVGMGGGFTLVVWPQVLLQILTELQHVYPPCTVATAITDLLIVNAFDDLGTVRQVICFRVRRPVLRCQL